MPRYPQLQDEAWLREQVKSKPLRQIAEEIGCTYGAVQHAVKRFGITVPHRSKHRYNAEKSANIKKALAARYPEGRTGAKAGNWRGGRSYNADGYVFVYAPDHPRAGRHKRVFEHILVAEKQLGRYLKPGEIVHHINHVKDDNRPENLMVTGRGAHVSNHFAEGKRTADAELEVERLRAILRVHNIPTEEDE